MLKHLNGIDEFYNPHFNKTSLLAYEETNCKIDQSLNASIYMGLHTRKPVFGVCEQQKPLTKLSGSAHGINIKRLIHCKSQEADTLLLC